MPEPSEVRTLLRTTAPTVAAYLLRGIGTDSAVSKYWYCYNTRYTSVINSPPKHLYYV